MVNKGPKSVEVVQFIRKQGFHAVRGNHEVRILEVLNMPISERPAKYAYLEHLTRLILFILFEFFKIFMKSFAQYSTARTETGSATSHTPSLSPPWKP